MQQRLRPTDGLKEPGTPGLPLKIGAVHDPARLGARDEDLGILYDPGTSFFLNLLKQLSGLIKRSEVFVTSSGSMIYIASETSLEGGLVQGQVVGAGGAQLQRCRELSQ
ncbi:hypothetical protein PG995_002798 [Apiospora arundinis]